MSSTQSTTFKAAAPTGQPQLQSGMDFLEEIYANLGFPDPAGSNRKALESALIDCSKRIADYLGNVAKNPVFEGKEIPNEEPLPLEAAPLPAILDETFQKIVRSSMHLSHPRYMAHMDSGVAFAGMMGDFIASSLNQNMLAQELSPAATAIETRVIRWFCNAAGLPKQSGGTFVGGGTMANLTGLLAARDRAIPNLSQKGLAKNPPLCLFTSAQSHYSIQKIAAILGLGSDAAIAIPCDSNYSMQTGELRRRITEQRKAGEKPFAIVGTLGTTSTGSIDPLEELAAIAKEEGLWFHVDASHGGALLFCSSQREKIRGIEKADSIAIDPHKWLWAPKSAGICLLKDFAAFRPAQYEAPYLDRKDKRNDLGRKTVDGSRHFDSLKVWMMFRHLGAQRIDGLIQRNLDMTKFLYQQIEKSSTWRNLHQPAMNVLCFASKKSPGEEEKAYQRLLESGKAWISITKLGQQPALRTVILNPSTREEDLLEILRSLESKSA